jgi:hypothetical protein
MRMYAISWARVLGVFICLLGWTVPAFSKEVLLEEVSISLFNKPVTGFKIVLDRSERFVANQIIEHVAASDNTSPFQYERSIIYENIRYEPIVDDRDISLYFLLKSIQGQFTELTVVVMYDYRRSISSRDFPELALKLKVDLAKLVRHAAGDVMRAGDVLYDDATLSQLEADPKPINTPDPQPMVEHFKQEEVDNNAVLLRRDPFLQDPANAAGGTNDTNLQRLTARIQQLEQREQALMTTERELRNEQATLQRKQEVLQMKVKENKNLHDSVVVLNQRVEALLGQAYVADDVSVSNETANEILSLEKETNRQKRQLSLLRIENDSLQKVATLYGQQLNRLSTSGKSASSLIAELEDQNKALTKQVEQYQTRAALSGDDSQRTAIADSLLGLLASAQLQNEALHSDMESQNRSLGRLKQENDELSGKRMQLEERMASLESENRSLRAGNAEVLASMPDENLIDSLNGEIRAARRSAGISKAELTQVRTDMETLQQQKDAQERQLVAAQTEQKNLQGRIEALIASGNREGGAAKQPASQQLSDSLLLLRQQLSIAEARAAEASATQDALSRAQAQLQTKERELRAAQTSLQEKASELAEAQRAKITLQKSLTDANTRLAEYQNSKGTSQQELDRLQQENRSLTSNLNGKEQQLGKVTAENKTTRDSVAMLRQQRSGLQADIAARDGNLRLQMQQRDSLQKQLQLASKREKALGLEIMALQTRVDSLARMRVPEGDQARYLKEQRSKLDLLQKDLEARDLASTDKEKLISQRESVLQAKEVAFAKEEDRFKNLEEREKRLQLLEQQLNAREGVGSVDATPIQVRDGRVMEFGAQVPVFIVETSLGVKAVQRQVVGYMLSREELLDSQFPEILYRTAHLGELDSAPLELKVRIDTKAGGSILQISLRMSNGEYLGGDKYRDRNDAVKQLISKMLRYKI